VLTKPKDPARSLFILVAVVVLAVACVLTPHNYGDGGEYLLMAESLSRHLSPDLRSARDVDALIALRDRYGVWIPVDSVLQSYYPARDGRLYCYHFWGYSLVAIPAKLLLRAFHWNELKALQITNAALLAVSLFLAISWLDPKEGHREAFLALVAFGPQLWFVVWPHPEVFSFSLVVIALVAMRREFWHVSVFCAALASVQNPPLVLLAAFLWLRAVFRRGGGLSRLCTLSASLTLAAAPYLFYALKYGVPNLIVDRGLAGSAFMSFGKGVELLLDLNIGMLPYIPVTLVLFFWQVGRALLPSVRSWLAFQLLGLLLAMMWLCTATWNWNHGTSGPSRYVIWMLPVVYFVASGLHVAPAASGSPTGGASLGLGLAVASQVIIVLARGGMIPRQDYHEHSYLARLTLRCCPSLYNPSYEVFAARTLHHSDPFKGPVVYKDHGFCRKALAKGDHRSALEGLCGSIPKDAASFFDDPENSRKWTYVNY